MSVWETGFRIRIALFSLLLSFPRCFLRTQSQNWEKKKKEEGRGLKTDFSDRFPSAVFVLRQLVCSSSFPHQGVYFANKFDLRCLRRNQNIRRKKPSCVFNCISSSFSLSLSPTYTIEYGSCGEGGSLNSEGETQCELSSSPRRTKHWHEEVAMEEGGPTDGGGSSNSPPLRCWVPDSAKSHGGTSPPPPL